MNYDDSNNYSTGGFVSGAFILTVGVVIMKILGAIYKVPIQHILGDDGYALFISTYNVYNVFLTLATAGLPVALSRLISEANAERRPLQIKKTFNVAYWTFFVIGLFCSLIMFLFPNWLAGDILNNPDAACGIKVMSPAVFLVCLISAYRGYCQGLENMIPTTVGQVLEVLFKVIAGLLLAKHFMNSGKGKIVANGGAIFGVVFGSIICLLYMIWYKRRHYKDSAEDIEFERLKENIFDDEDGVIDWESIKEPEPDSDSVILKKFLRIGIPIALGASIMSLLNLVDSGLCMGRLQSAAGFSYQDAKTLFGVYGSAMTLFNLPAAFITPLTITVVPAIAAAIVRKESAETARISEDALRLATVICLPMGIGLAVLSFPIMKVVYPNSHYLGPTLLSIMGVASFFVCFALIQNAILQAAGHEKFPVISMICGSIVKVAVNWFLVALPSLNIVGAPIGTLLGYMTMCVMNHLFMAKKLEHTPNIRRICLKPFIAVAIMGVAAIVTYKITGHFFGFDTWKSLIADLGLSVVCAVIIYFIMIFSLKIITGEDLKLIPKGDKIAKLLRIE